MNPAAFSDDVADVLAWTLSGQAKGHLLTLNPAAATVVHPKYSNGQRQNGYRDILLYHLILVWHIVHHVIELVDRRRCHENTGPNRGKEGGTRQHERPGRSRHASKGSDHPRGPTGQVAEILQQPVERNRTSHEGGRGLWFQPVDEHWAIAAVWRKRPHRHDKLRREYRFRRSDRLRLTIDGETGGCSILPWIVA